MNTKSENALRCRREPDAFSNLHLLPFTFYLLLFTFYSVLPPSPPRLELAQNPGKMKPRLAPVTAGAAEVEEDALKAAGELECGVGFHGRVVLFDWTTCAA